MPSFYSSPIAEEVGGIVRAERGAFATKEVEALWNHTESLDRNHGRIEKQLQSC